MALSVGIVPVNSGAYIGQNFLIEFGKIVENLGYESLWTFEHVIIPEEYKSIYPYNPKGKIALSGQESFVDPLIAISFLAAATQKLRFGTGVNILSQSNPLYLAKQVSSIDHLSGGRLSLGVGVGWLEEEFKALGVPFNRRGPRADEYLDGMRQVWSGEVTNIEGQFLSWNGFRMLPTPAQLEPGTGRPAVPIIIGGTSDSAIRRTVKRGNGWYVIHRDLEHFRQLMTRLRSECEKQERDISELEITAYWNFGREGLEGARAYEEEGVHRLLINTAALHMGDPISAAKRFAEEVFPNL